jgi:hypothetical protein
LVQTPDDIEYRCEKTEYKDLIHFFEVFDGEKWIVVEKIQHWTDGFTNPGFIIDGPWTPIIVKWIEEAKAKIVREDEDEDEDVYRKARDYWASKH